MKMRIALKTISFSLVITLLSLSAFAQYESYVDNLPQPVQITTETIEVQQELEARVQEMVTLGHMAPTFYLSGGLIPFYITPSETIYTLSVAYPYLSASLQSQVKTYLDNELNTYPPHSTAFYPPHAGKISDIPGARREYFTPNPNQDFGVWYQDPPSGNWVLPSIHVSTLYSIWVYSYYTGDWTYATNNYTSLKNIYTSFKASGPVQSYAELAGVIGFARIAKQLGYTADYNDALSFAEQGFAAGTDFNQFLATAKINYPTGRFTFTTQIFMALRNPVVVHFNRDLGLFLGDNALTQAAAYAYADELNTELPLSWLTQVGLGGIRHVGNKTVEHGGKLYATPEIGWTYFMLRAYVLGDSVQQLKSYLDKPDRKGDLLYIQKLVATIEAENSP